MQPEILANAPRCGARTRSGDPCRSPAVAGHRRCRMHGGKGSGAPRGNSNARKHGIYSARFRAIARYVRGTSVTLRMAGLILRTHTMARRRENQAVPRPVRGGDPLRPERCPAEKIK